MAQSDQLLVVVARVALLTTLVLLEHTHLSLQLLTNL